MPTLSECKPEHHTWHPSPTGMGPVLCYHCGAVRPGTEARVLAPVAAGTRTPPLSPARVATQKFFQKSKK